MSQILGIRRGKENKQKPIQKPESRDYIREIVAENNELRHASITILRMLERAKREVPGFEEFLNSYQEAE